ncbi:oxidoreductase family protein [Mariniblastus fucicola]|uniref:oxidoreductase family protein n=1 Tax=Mariniblastus fucicola TaxID=980251 RepID=UPI001FD24D7F|nr:oxidoreductase family protein [Mariniblastus fucicola]
MPTDQIAKLCGAESVEIVESIQSLWSGYGEIVRLHLVPQNETVVVKFVSPPEDRSHKYGWESDVSHQRKLSSYANERAWYNGASSECRERCRMANLIASEAVENRWLFVLEDLDKAGFPIRSSGVNERQLNSCLRWLANLHASFLFDTRIPNSQISAIEHGLWPTGTYWHLDTRPDEYDSMPGGVLKNSAASIDQKLNSARFQTIVHGDAKLANFCFSESDDVAVVDFQYVGGGCGMKDFAYFISSCFSDSECESQESDLLQTYFDYLSLAVDDKSLFDAIEEEWRSLYAFAWADFHRFLAGWSPGHWKIHRYSKRLTEQALAQLQN